MESLFNWLYDLMYQNDALSLVSSFGWGVLSVVISPCHLAALPLLIAYIANQSNSKAASPFKLSLLFSLGILATIFIIGLVTASLGRLLGDIGSWSSIITGLFLIIAGLFFLDLLNINTIKLNTSRPGKFKGGLFAFVFGLTAGLALGPCTFAFMAPVFAYGFQISLTKPLIAFSLFLSYGVGHCVVILITGVLSARIQSYLSWVGSSKSVIIFKKACGVLVIAGGIYILYQGALL